MNILRTFDLLERYKEKYSKDDALCFKQNGTWIKYTTQEYIEYSYNLCYGLYELGLRKGDKIISISSNRPEWNFIDMGMSMLGIVHVPVFTSLSSAEYEYIIKDSGARMIFISDNKLYKCVSPALEGSGSSLRLYTFDKVKGAANWSEIVKRGKSCSEKTRSEIEKEKSLIDPGTFATLIYTSGTTGKPKGVMLSQKNLVNNFISAASVFNLKSTDKYLSILNIHIIYAMVFMNLV